MSFREVSLESLSDVLGLVERTSWAFCSKLVRLYLVDLDERNVSDDLLYATVDRCAKFENILLGAEPCFGGIKGDSGHSMPLQLPSPR